MRKLDLTGKKFGKWTVIKEGQKRGEKNRWLCECECGRQSQCYVSDLTSGKSVACRSCGRASHGFSSPTIGRKRVYNIWIAMRQRCRNRNHKHFKYYGGRGIKVCQRWDDFSNFLADMGRPPTKKHSIDRINNDGDYTPDNCRWATNAQQQANKRKRGTAS